MNRGKQKLVPANGGYTIVEVLIFLGVSAIMFFTALLFIGGQQNKAQFSTSVRDFETKLTDIANDVATGYYTKPVNFSCSATGAGPSRRPDVSSSMTDTQGTNNECIFAGTVVKFGDDSNGGAGPEGYMQFAMAGLRTDSGGVNVTTLEAAKPQPIFHPSSDLRNAVSTYNFGYGTKVVCIGVNVGSDGCDPSATGNAALGFYSTFSQANSSGQGSGIQTDILPYSNVHIDEGNTTQLNIELSKAVNSNDLNPAKGVVICLESSNEKQYALIRIGGPAGSISINTEIKNIAGGNTLCE